MREARMDQTEAQDPRVLVIDDDDDLRELMTAHVKLEEYKDFVRGAIWEARDRSEREDRRQGGQRADAGVSKQEPRLNRAVLGV
jgi:hypothetical protein